MNEEARTALLASIEKWEKNLKQDRWSGVITSALDCPLCVLYMLSKSPVCLGCPVHEKTQIKGCGGTPYTQVMMFKETAEHDDTILDFERQAIQDEVNFLRSLLEDADDKH